MTAEIINIGDELLIGQVVNINCSYMSQKLIGIGMSVQYITVIGDDALQIKNAVLQAIQRSDAVLITGGLGPTKDDITKHCLCEMFGGKLTENVEVSNHVRKFFEARNLPYTQTNRSQAFVPDCCQVIFNPIGTAPGMVFKSDDCLLMSEQTRQSNKGKLIVSMPGVPFEMQKMMEAVTEIFLKHYTMQTIIHKSVSLSGIGESFLSDKLESFEKKIQEINNGKTLFDQKTSAPHFSLAYLPEAGMIKLRLSAYGGQRQQTLQIFNSLYDTLKTEIGSYIVSEDGKNIAQIIGENLQLHNWTLASAESCTGGNIAHKITLNPGASSYFKGGVVSYCNEIKHKVLNVSDEVLNQYGAVSEQTAKQMAENVLQLYGTDFSIATTGLAGPDSDGSNNEIGTVYVAVAMRNGLTEVKKNCFKTSRENFIDRVTNFAFFELLQKIRHAV